MDIPEPLNFDFIDAQYQLWRKDPQAVSTDWQFFFQGFQMAETQTGPMPGVGDDTPAMKQCRVSALIQRYRDLGHLLSCIDPLVACPTEHPLLGLEAMDLAPEDLESEFYLSSAGGQHRQPLHEIIRMLKATYCRGVGVEYMHIQDPDERAWLQEQMEQSRNRTEFNAAGKRHILTMLSRSALFEAFLNKKYPGQTRFSLEGADAVVAMLDALNRYLAENGCKEVIVGTAHRGRLNIQAHVLGKSYEDIFSEFEHCYSPDSLVGAGDVKYHNGFMIDKTFADGQTMRLVLVNNPSHLESVNPVVEGIVRARQDQRSDDAGKAVVPILIHGDAAFAGQGIVAETLNMSQLKGYRTDGTIHVIINNQIGYTTLPEDARSTRYSTDVAKMLMVPIFHVHGEDPEAVVHVIRLAAAYRMRYRKDVVVDVICYRRYGHNEGDEPYFTQPLMYERIKARPPLNRQYADQLLQEGVVTQDHIDQLEAEVRRDLNESMRVIKEEACPFPEPTFYADWNAYHGRYTHDPLPTGIGMKKLKDLARRLNTVPKGFDVHRKLNLLLKRRLQAVQDGDGIDWANAESLAFASLLTEQVPIRLSGQDSGRGTFSQRHSVLINTRTGERYLPLNHLDADQAPFQVYDSMLAEMSIMGFDYGYSMARPGGLTLWEAQFGDFANNAQSMMDLYIASGEAKWQRLSGLVLLLPHGLDGLGPEHSSARPERILQLCADDNILVVNATTPAQYFHLLRRQVKQSYRKPLFVMAPKSLLRHPEAVSTLKALSSGAFETVLGDPAAPKKPRRVMFCSGKVYYDLVERRKAVNGKDSAVVRIEQIYPFPTERLQEICRAYRGAKQWYWVQEEAANMGAWQFVRPLLEDMVGKPLQYIGRPVSASPASGFPSVYRHQKEAFIAAAMGAQP